jgi:hypothetical protein
LLLGAMIAAGGAGVLAQDATPVDTEATATTAVTGRPAHIHSGTCDALGDVVAPLTDLTLAGGGTGTNMTTMTGMTGVIPAEYSFTTVPLALDDILSADHAINVHESAANIGNYIACGDLTGGTVDANGSLVVGIKELNGSGFTGIAVLSPNAADAATTDVSVFIAQNLSQGGLDLGTPAS